ncbi:cupin domain-containing protein [Streptomyces sp. NPDC055078]
MTTPSTVSFPAAGDAAGAARLARTLGLTPIEGEGGLLRRMHADRNITASVYMMIAPDFSALHSLDCAEVYHWQGGSPVELLMLHRDGAAEHLVLGPDIATGQQLQATVPPGSWQGSRPLGAWSVVGLTTAPPFRFDGFVLPGRDELLSGWPHQRERIIALTRED